MVSQAATAAFRTSLRGVSFVPGEPGYDAARVVFNRIVDRRPAIIARCAGAADVIACVGFAREQDLPVSVRGGGHSIAGKAICDDGLMIDLSAMKGIRVDPATRTVRAEPGLTIGEFDRETQAFGLATTMGVISTTGIAGLTLGGGMGWLIGKHGLACDNVIAMDVVTADGRLLKASEQENPDLFWGMRGGGGNFGIVTSFEYRLHQLGPVFGGGVLYPVDQARDVLRFYRDFAFSGPDELSTQVGRICTLEGVPVIGVAGCYSGSLEEGEKVLAPLRRFGSPVADLFGPMSYLQMQTMFDPWFPPGRQAYWKANFLHGLPDEAIEVFHRYALDGTLAVHHRAMARERAWRGLADRLRLTLHSPIAGTRSIFWCCRVGPRRPRPNGIFSGRANAGTPCVRSWFPARMSIISRRRPIPARAQPMAPITTGSSR